METSGSFYKKSLILGNKITVLDNSSGINKSPAAAMAISSIAAGRMPVADGKSINYAGAGNIKTPDVCISGNVPFVVKIK